MGVMGVMGVMGDKTHKSSIVMDGGGP
jgi:hypothetical protein